MLKTNISYGLCIHSPLILSRWLFHTAAQAWASLLMVSRNKWWRSHIWAGILGLRPQFASRSWKRSFHFCPKPRVTSYQRRSIRVLWTLLKCKFNHKSMYIDNHLEMNLTAPKCRIHGSSHSSPSSTVLRGDFQSHDLLGPCLVHCTQIYPPWTDPVQ